MEDDIPEVYHMHVTEPWFSHIKEGRKPVEGRKMFGTWSKLKVGDIIHMKNGNDRFDVKVTGLTVYPPSLEDPLTSYLESEALERALPGVNSLEEGRRIYLQWSTEEEIHQKGMMGIQVEVIPECYQCGSQNQYFEKFTEYKNKLYCNSCLRDNYEYTNDMTILKFCGGLRGVYDRSPAKYSHEYQGETHECPECGGTFCEECMWIYKFRNYDEYKCRDCNHIQSGP